ncbi:MAG: hypothetical protein K2J08_11965 [Ruminococcus sp.]|nr:hypothetical protein [Ruminococcus sp.]
MAVYDKNDIVEIKNRKKRKKKRTRFFIFLIIVSIAFGLYSTRDMWLSKMRGIGKQYKTIINSGQLAEGNFPIEISGEYNYQLRQTQDKIIILSDVSLFFYDTDGNLMRKRQHGYTNAVLRADNGRALIYENGGDDFCIENEEGILYEKKFDDNIMFVRISPDGYTAVVTTSENYDCEMHVYDKKGNLIYEKKFMERVNDISFTDNSGGCVVSYISAEKGSLVTTVQKINFMQVTEQWTSPAIDTAGLEIFGFNAGAFVLGMNACGYINENGQISSYYQYDGELKGGASSGGASAVIINNDDRRRYVMVLFRGGATEPIIIDLGQQTVDVAVHDGLAYVMCKEEIRAYNFNGELRSTAVIPDSYNGFVRSSEHIFLKGYNRIDRIDYES